MDFDDYLNHIPALHSWDGGATWNSGGFGAFELRRIYDFARNATPYQPSVIETGAGNSTLCFLFLNPKKLISIDPDQGLFEKIRAYCTQNAIPVSALDCRIERSEWVLPNLAASARSAQPEYDFAFIDGCHNWPMVMLDFFYMNFMVKTGGYIMIDDVQLHSVKELARLLKYDKFNFRLREDIGKTLIFEKLTGQRELPDWGGQPYIVSMSDGYKKAGDPFAL